MWAVSRSVRVANESRMSRAVRSMITPRERSRADPFHQGVPQLRQIGIRQGRLDGGDEVVALLENRDFHLAAPLSLDSFAHGGDLVAQDMLGFLDPSLQIANRVHLAQVHADVDQRLGDVRREAGDDDRCAKKA